MDNLNTHNIASLYEASRPPEARRLADYHGEQEPLNGGEFPGRMLGAAAVLGMLAVP